MVEEKSLVPYQQSALDVYGRGQEIEELALRLKKYLPGGDKLSGEEALAISQLALAYGLNPFNGEVWGLKGRDGKFVGTMVGIKGLRKAARKQANYWTRFERLNDQEKIALGLNAKDVIAYRCLLYRTDLMLEAANVIGMMVKAGIKDAADRLSYEPFVGFGICTLSESTRMSKEIAARKRAEADALKQAFDLPFGSESDGERIGYVDGEWEEVQPRMAEEERKTATELLHGEEGFKGFGDEEEPKEEPKEEPEEEPEEELKPWYVRAKERYANAPRPWEPLSVKGFVGLCTVEYNEDKPDGNGPAPQRKVDGIKKLIPGDANTVIEYVTGNSTITIAEANGLFVWIHDESNEDGWVKNPNVEAEASSIIDLVMSKRLGKVGKVATK